jgi:hypothetical protein
VAATNKTQKERITLWLMKQQAKSRTRKVAAVLKKTPIPMR